MQYLASSPRHMPTHTNAHKKGSNPPFLFSLRSQARLTAKQKKKKTDLPCNSSTHPQLFYWCWTFISDADLNQVLRVAVLALRARHCVHAMESQPHLLLLFLHGSLWGHTPRHNQHSALHPSPWLWQLRWLRSRKPDLSPSFGHRSRCVCSWVRRKAPPGVLWLPGEESFQMSDVCEVVGHGLMRQLYLHVIKVRFKCVSSHMHQQF